MIRRATILVPALAISVTCALPAIAGAEFSPPSLYTSSQMSRGETLGVQANGVDPFRQYVLSTTAGTWANGQSSITRTADQYRKLGARFTLDTDAPAVTDVTLTLTVPGDATVLAQKVVHVAPPSLQTEQLGPAPACPGRTIPVFTYGFPLGSYTVSSPDAGFAPDQLTSDGNGLGRFTMSIAADAPAKVPVTVTADGGPTYDFTVKLWHQAEAEVSGTSTPWTKRWTASCFVPGETVSAVSVPPHVTAPSAVGAGTSGDIAFSTVLHPQAHAVTIAPITYTGASGQSTSTVRLTLPGTTLRTGDAFGDDGRLLSARPGYELAMNGCGPTIFRYDAHGVRTSMWSVRKSARRATGCTLALRGHGNLELLSRSGKVLWQTHSTGSRGGNRLVMRSDGYLVIFDASGKIIWSSHVA